MCSCSVHVVVIVVSLLNALIKDQIRRTSEGGVKAVSLNVRKKKNSDDLELDVGDANFTLLKEAKYDIVFTHPEIFLLTKEGRELFQSEPYQRSVKAIVVDEAHCISEW